jgi:hypothetical protein
MINPADIYKPDPDMANTRNVLNAIAFHIPWRENGEGPSTWTKVGTVTMTIDFDDPKDMVVSKVKALRKKKEDVLAKAQVEANNIEDDIQKLLSITYEPK